jgi:uncharacterized protein (DUF433 family)
MSAIQAASETVPPQPTVIRTNRGLSIAGTRITLYSLLDYLHAGWPPHLLRDEFNLTDHQVAEVMKYIEAHRDEVETEYQTVLQQAEENRQYWEARNKEQLARLQPSRLSRGKKNCALSCERQKKSWACRDHAPR